MYMRNYLHEISQALSIEMVLLFVLIFTALILYKLFKHGSKFENTSDIKWLSPPNNKLEFDQNHFMAYRQFGQGQDVLFIHGIGANTFCWRLLSPLFDSTKYKLTIIDLPGFGYSSKSNTLNYDLNEQCSSLLKLIEKLNLDKPILIGSSMGGTIALMLSLAKDNQFSKVIAIAPAAGRTLIPKLLRKIKFVSYYFNWTLNKKYMILILKRIFTNKQLISPTTVEGYLKPYLNNKTESIRAFVNSGHLIMDKRLPQCFNNLKVTPLILASKKDKMVRKRHIKNLLSCIPNYEFCLHNKAGHHIMEDDPKWVYDQINKYLS